jgi:predicted acyl esterase
VCASATAALALVAPLAFFAPQVSADVAGQQVVDVAHCYVLGGLPTDTYSRVSRAPLYSTLPDEFHDLPSAVDGESIQIGIVRPAVPAGTEVPVIMLASPYFGPDLRHYPLTSCVPRLVKNFVPQGYAVAFVPVRGFSGAGGCPDLFGPLERSDLNQAVTWLGRRSWSNGSVGMVGLSYDGSTPWEVAATGNPHLKTIVPISGISDIFDLMFGEGVSDNRGLFVHEGYRLQGLAFKNLAWGTSSEQTAGMADCPAVVAGTRASLHSHLTGERDPGGWFAARNYRPGVLAKYGGSVLLAQGLQDWNVDPNHQLPWIDELPERIPVKKLLGQWGHSYPDGQPTESAPKYPCHRDDWADILLTWFDRYLYGDTSADTGPAVQVQDSTMQWRNAVAWPPADVAPMQLQLTAAKTLSEVTEPNAAQLLVGPAVDSIVERQSSPYDWACEELQTLPPTAAVAADFRSAPYSSEFRFAGMPAIDLTVTATGPAGHITGYLFSEAADGTTTQLGWGQVDLRFPQGGEAASAVTPGVAVAIRLPIQPLDAVVHAGSRLRLILAQGNDSDHLPSVPSYPVQVQVGGGASTMTLPVTRPASTDFFVPPVQ